MIRNKKGFSLLELILVLGIASAVSFMKFQDLKQEQENIQAKAVGQQIKQIGDAVNGYINIRYDKLSTLTSVSSSTGTDPGPRTCSAANNTCTITYQTLVNEGLLPASFSGMNANHSPYAIILRRSGGAPNYQIDGLITTTMQWKDGDKIRYDLLGKAMQAAGVDSGVSKTTSSVSGYSGQWAEQAANYNNISASGLLAYRAGYSSTLYSVYLRRDGTLPMTGDLNMDGKSINNVANISASGAITAAGLQSTGAATIGGALTVAGASTLTGPATLGNTLTVNGTSTLKGATTVSNSLTVTGNAQVNGGIAANGRIQGGDIYSNSETYTNNWFRTMGDGGIYFQKYGGGWYMADTATITAYAGKNISTPAGVYGGYIHSSGNIDSAADMNSNRIFSNYIHSNGQLDAAGKIISGSRLTTNEFLQINGVAGAGGGCVPNGLQGRTPSGAILSCVNGVWQSAATTIPCRNTRTGELIRNLTIRALGGSEPWGDPLADDIYISCDNNGNVAVVSGIGH